MENIPLRLYNREIEQLIDSNRSQDALKHCQQILDNYPRCLETFRLLGKAYLELHQFALAEETFRKVLESIPDDFTGNLGMSLLCEKQNNLSETIRHMERAYEAQPSNTAVQSELRRLYQQRDGVETARIRLTRGALVRMYLRGDLIPQALNEIQAILHDDPSRIDIRILQSIALLNSGKVDESLQICRQILQEYPYCFEANKLLFENSPASTRIEEAQKYQQHLRELDPYYEFTSKTNPDPDKVPNEEVKIKILEGLQLQNPTVSTEAIPPLSAFETLSKNPPVEAVDFKGVENNHFDFEQKSPHEEEKPAWLEGIEIATFKDEAKTTQSEFSSESSYTPRKEFELSEPMTTEESSQYNEYSLGNDASSDNPSEDALPANPFLTSTGGQIPVAEPGDIPEWLRALASEPPAASSDAITAPLRVPGETGVLQTGEENLDFLRNIPGEPQSPSATPTDLPERKLNLAAESLPTLLPADPFLVTSETTQPIPIENNEVIKTEPVGEIPNWLNSTTEEIVEKPSEAVIRPEFSLETPQIQNIEPSFSVDDFQMPAEPQIQAQAEPQGQEEVPTPEIEQYLEQLRMDISPGEQPEWLKKDNLGSDIEALFNEENKPAVPPPSSDKTPDWMADLKKEDLDQPRTPQVNPPISVPNVPDWLFTPETNEEDTAPIDLETPVTKQPSPDWLKDVKPEVLGLTEKQESYDPGQIPSGVTEEPAPDLSFLDSKTFDFQQADRDLFVDNFNISEDSAGEGLPADLAALLREETDKEVNTNPLPDEEPVASTFTPSDFFTDMGFQTENVIEEEKQSPTPLGEMSLNLEAEAEPEIKFDTEEQLPPESLAQFKETGPVFSAEVIQPLEPPVTFEEPEVIDQILPAEEVKPIFEEQIPEIEKVIEKPAAQFIPEEIPVAQFSTGKEPDVQFIPDDEPVTQTIPEEEPIAQFIPEEIPVAQIIPDEEPVAVFIPEEEPAAQVVPEVKPVDQPVPVEKPTATFEKMETPVAQPVPEQKPVARVIAEEKPVIKEKHVAPTPPPAKPVHVPVARKPAPRIEKPVEPIQKRSGGAADLARAREAVSRGDLISALRRYIKLVNSNKSLDHVSSDLKDLVRKNPKNYLAWQTYGDARLRSNRIQEALDAYAKAADLLK